MKYVNVIFYISLLIFISPVTGKTQGIGNTCVKVVIKNRNEHTVNILKKRFTDYIGKNISVHPSGNVITLKIPAIIDSVLVDKLLKTKGEFLIAETYPASVIYPHLVKIDSLLATPKMSRLAKQLYPDVHFFSDEDEYDDDSNSLGFSDFDDDDKKRHPLFYFFSPSNPSQRYYSSVGSALLRDTAKLNMVMNNSVIKQSLPAEAVFLWQTNNLQRDMAVELFAVKNTHDNNSKSIDNKSIEKISISAEFGYPQINLQLKKDYHDSWEKLTSDNVGMALAILIDNKILIAPTVSQPIKEGKLSISGGMNWEQNRLLKAVLSNDTLSEDIEITELTYEYAPMHYLLNVFNKLKK